MYACMQQAISKDLTSLRKTIRLPLHEFTRKASPNRQRLVIPEARKMHMGTDRPRGQKDMPTRHEDCRLVPNQAPDLSTDHKSGCGIEEGNGWGNRQNKLPKKKKRSKKGIAE